MALHRKGHSAQSCHQVYPQAVGEGAPAYGLIRNSGEFQTPSLKMAGNCRPGILLEPLTCLHCTAMHTAHEIDLIAMYCPVSWQVA